MTKIRVAICSDHLISRAGLRSILGAQQQFEIVSESSVSGAAHQARADSADVVVVHAPEIGSRSARVVRELGRQPGRAIVVIMNSAPHEGVLASLLRAGALGCVLTRSHPSELTQAVISAAHGRRHIDPVLNERVIDALLREESRLSGRERQVLDGLAHGITQREIGARLGVSTKTVETYRRRLAEKMNLRTRADIVQFALAMGLLRTEDDVDNELTA